MKQHDVARIDLASANQTPLSEIMNTNVFCAREHMALHEVSRTFLESGISGAPVIDEQGYPVGVISKTDLIRFAYEQQADEPQTTASHGSSKEAVPHALVRDVMTPVAYALTPEVSIARASALMAFEGIHRIPIVARPSGKLIGLLASTDVLRWIGEQSGYLRQREAAVA